MQMMQRVQSLRQARKQKGFTIIELVVVILLLGILAATALPRFMDVTDQAHEAVVDAVQGGLATGSALLRAQWFAEGQPTIVTGFGDGNVIANTQGYPGLPTTNSAGCAAVYNELLQSGRPQVAGVDQLGAVAQNEDEDDDAGETITTSFQGATSTSVQSAAATVEFIAILDQASANTTAYYCENDGAGGCLNDEYYTDAGLTTLVDNGGPNEGELPGLAPAGSCLYVYVGQFKTAAAALSVPVLRFNLTTGEISRETYGFEPDA
ncbi:MAG: type II secretion system protein [Gammaproteobacteria bacterium]|nr:type II secretion system protein [Gammaproteobacteria bacterium]MDP2139927.1 type II secretion system protein [Gammaproteobacteria bacterium]MDP2347747.1 type II secretion system protein [Gammaproteobacteria bacterium]